MVDVTGGNLEEKLAKKIVIAPYFMDRIRASFFDSFFAILDGIHFIAFHPNAWEQWTLSDTQKNLKPDSCRLDPSKKETRLLVALCNIVHLRDMVIPSQVRLFQELFKTNFLQEAQVWMISGQSQHGIDFFEETGGYR